MKAQRAFDTTFIARLTNTDDEEDGLGATLSSSVEQTCARSVWSLWSRQGNDDTVGLLCNWEDNRLDIFVST